MTIFKSVMSGVALAGATALLSVSALADGPSDHGSRPFSWTGFYVGVNAGWARGDADLRSKMGCIPKNQDDFCLVQAPDALAFVGAQGTGGANVDGFTGGIQAGYLWQQGKVAFGYEVDFNSLDLGGTRGGQGILPDGTGRTADVGASISADWLFTFRGRLGVALVPNVLAYATGGFALTDLEVINSYNMGIDGLGRIVLQEDTGGNNRLGRIYVYGIDTGKLVEVARANAKFFGGNATTNPTFLTNNEESSGVIDAASFLGQGWFLMSVQNHRPSSDAELVEGGQLMAMFIHPSIAQ